MGANPHANGGMLLRDLRMPDFRDYAVNVPTPGGAASANTHVLGPFLRDVVKLNREQRNFRVFGPDETTLQSAGGAVFEVTNRQWDAADTVPNDEFLAPDGRVMEMLSEHQCEGWLEGYLLTGRHGFFNCYEAFIHIIDSMFNQHAKWLKVTIGSAVAAADRLAELPAGFARLAAGSQRLHPSGSRLHRPRREQEGRGRARLSAAGCQLPAVGDGPLPAQPPLRQRRGRGQTSGAAVADDGCGHQALHRGHRYLAVGQQRSGWRARRGHGLLRRRADAGDAGRRLHSCASTLPELKIRVVNVVDLMKLQPPSEHPHGLSDTDFDALFTKDKPVIFAFHGYPWLIHRLTYRRTNHDNIHVRGYKEEGTITTPFDMTVLNDLDRFHS